MDDNKYIALTGCSRSSETCGHNGQTSRQQQTANLSARMDENIDQVNSMVLSQEDQPRTHSTVRKISRKMGVPKSSVVHLIRKDLQLKCFKRRRTQELSEANCTARKLLLKKVFPVCRGLCLLYR